MENALGCHPRKDVANIVDTSFTKILQMPLLQAVRLESEGFGYHEFFSDHMYMLADQQSNLSPRVA